MKLPRRQFLHLAAGGAALATVSRVARAQAYPARPVRLVVGFAAGGARLPEPECRISTVGLGCARVSGAAGTILPGRARTYYGWPFYSRFPGSSAVIKAQGAVVRGLPAGPHSRA